MIDLHLHTTASDGRSSPAALVREAVAAGITTLAVTDHDTVAAVPEVRETAEAAGVAFVAGIEITAVERRRDVHVLGYGMDPAHPALGRFLASQRDVRRRRLLAIGERLRALGVHIDVAAIVEAAGRGAGRAVGRPLVARALVDAGHAQDVADAFDRFLGEGRPAFVPRAGAPVADVVALVADAGGVASLAHPGAIGDDALVARLVADGMPALEAFHPDHGEADVSRYLGMADRSGLLVTGGSDYHGPGSGRTGGLGIVGLPEDRFAVLAARVGWT